MKKLFTSLVLSTLTFNNVIAGNMYVFKDQNGQVMLTNVVSNGKPAGNNFQNFTNLVKTNYYDSNAKAKPLNSKKTTNVTWSKIGSSSVRYFPMSRPNNHKIKIELG